MQSSKRFMLLFDMVNRFAEFVYSPRKADGGKH